jgi:hypothetical protein
VINEKIKVAKRKINTFLSKGESDDIEKFFLGK